MELLDGRSWASLLRAGGIAALLSAVLFRRNLGAEVSLFTGGRGHPALGMLSIPIRFLSLGVARPALRALAAGSVTRGG